MQSKFYILFNFYLKKFSKFQPARKILEINPKHPIIVELKNKIEKDENDPDAEDIAELLYETACLTSGYSLDEPSEFAQRIVRLMNKSFFFFL